MQKSIMSNGQRIATYYPITGRLQYASGKIERMDERTLKTICIENEWHIVWGGLTHC